MTDHQTYRDWSAAYLLGALDAAERKEFEPHLSSCEQCQRDVASFAPVPGLLSRIESPDIEQAPGRIADRAATQVRSELAGLVRSRGRWRWAAVAAAVALIALVASALPGRQVSQATELAIDPGSQAVGEITIETKPWGTSVEISLTDLPPHDRYIAWVVNRDGEWQQIAAWGPTPGARARVTGASSIPTNDIDAVVVTADDPGDTIATARVPSG